MKSHARKKVERKLSPLERRFTRSPVYMVTMMARIKGHVSEDMFRTAVLKVQQRHANLRARIVDDAEHHPWLTSEGAGDILVEIVPRTSEGQWLEEYDRQVRIPFNFSERPPIRFILVQSPDVSELIIFCHHVICDGKSLAYLVRDIMVCLGDPSHETEILPDPDPVDGSNLPADVSVNALFRFFINKVNQKWEKIKIHFDQEDYENILDAYWSSFSQRIVPIELSEDQTTELVHRCRKEKVTVNSALMTAFAGAQLAVQGPGAYDPNLGVIGSVRDRLRKPCEGAMGFYAGHVELKFRYRPKLDFWENARRFHKKVKPLYTNKNLFKEAILYEYLDPTLIEATPFKMMGGLVNSDASRYKKLFDFRKQNDVVLKVLKRRKVDSPSGIAMGTAITNLTNMDFPKQYGSLELDRLIMNPGISANYNIVLGTLTSVGKMSLVVGHIEQNLDAGSVDKIINLAIEFLS